LADLGTHTSKVVLTGSKTRYNTVTKSATFRITVQKVTISGCPGCQDHRDNQSRMHARGAPAEPPRMGQGAVYRTYKLSTDRYDTMKVRFGGKGTFHSVYSRIRTRESGEPG
jgi:hypothetical protein